MAQRPQRMGRAGSTTGQARPANSGSKIPHSTGFAILDYRAERRRSSGAKARLWRLGMSDLKVRPLKSFYEMALVQAL